MVKAKHLQKYEFCILHPLSSADHCELQKNVGACNLTAVTRRLV